jgi:outer membrane protein
MKRFFLLVFSAGITGIGLHAQNATSKIYTLQQCVEAGIAYNLRVQQSSLQMQADEVNWKQARLNMLPDLNAFINHGVQNGRSIDPFTNSYVNQRLSYANWGLSSGVILFNGMSMLNAVKQNRLNYEASKMDWQQQKDNLTLLMILAYLQVLSNEDIIVQLQNQLELTKKQVERLDALDKQGAIPPSQLSDLKGQYAGDEINLVNAQNALETAKLNLCQLMNIPYEKSISVEKLDMATFAEKYEDSPDKIYQTALQQFALVKNVEYSRQSAAMGVKVAKGRLYPTLSLGASINTNYSNAAESSVFLNNTYQASNDYVIVNGAQTPVIKQVSNYSYNKISYKDQLNNNRFSALGLNLRIPIFNSLQQRNRVRLAKITLKNSEVVEQTTKTQLQQNVEQAHLNMVTASEKYKKLLDQVEAFKESFRAAEISFNAGVGNSIDYLIVKNRMDQATINQIIAKYEYVLRTKILDYYKGVKLW